MPSTSWIPALLLFAAAAFGTLALVLFWEILRDWWERRTVQRQLQTLVGQGGPENPSGARSRADLRQRSTDDEEDAGWLAAIGTLPGVASSATLLEQADVDWSPLTFFLLMLGAAVGVGGSAFIISGSLLITAPLAGGGALIPYLYLHRRRRRITEAFERELPESLDLLTRAIRAGHPLSSGFRMVAEEGPHRAAEEFRKTFEEHRFGLPFEDALLGMVDRVGSVDVRIFATAVLIQRESGGNLAEILDKLATTIRDRFTIRRQLRIHTAQGRLSGYTLAALPPTVGLLIYLIEPEYVSILFTETIGHMLVVAALVLQIVGFLWIRKIINIEI